MAHTDVPLLYGIFSRAAAPLLDHAQHGIHSVSCVGELHLDRNDSQRRQRAEISSQINRIFFGGNKAAASLRFASSSKSRISFST